jgi:acyl carrier protein phosphodiesterase
VRWSEYSDESLEEFDRGVRDLLARNEALVPEELSRFMRYADRRGLFAAYRYESEILHSFSGIGRRFSKANPMHRVNEIWSELKPLFAASFPFVFRQVQREVADWLNSKSTMTGS